MPRLTEGRENNYLELVRRALVYNPSASVLLIQKILEKPSKDWPQGLHLDYHYLCRLVRKIRGERGARMNYQLINEELSKMEDTTLAVIEDLWKVSKNTSDDQARVAALKGIVQSLDTLLNRKFDAGVFKKDLGTIKLEQVLEERKVLILKAAENYFIKNGSRKRSSTKISLESG